MAANRLHADHRVEPFFAPSAVSIVFEKTGASRMLYSFL